jgi:hypothetical protein
MSLQMILAPLFVQVALTFALMLLMASRRAQASRAGQVRASEIALREPNWPGPALQAAYSYSNQFELPVLFYVLTVLALFTKQADLAFVLLAWVFVALRCLQALVHVTSNRVRYRGLFFGASALVLMIMWAVFILRILLS